MKRRLLCRTLSPLFLVPLCWCAGCGPLPDGRRWGQDVTLAPGWDRIRRAAVNAVCETGTWVPVAGALAFTIGDFDENASDWAMEHTPLFGSRDAAADASDQLVDGLQLWALATALATSSGESPGSWTWAKIKGLAVEKAGIEIAALDLNKLSTRWLKTEIGRNRPDGSDSASFPSGHSADAFGAATLASRNLEYINMPEPLRDTLQAGTVMSATATAWARVEAGKHYPSDVLAGAALAHFVTVFIHDAFLGLPNDEEHLVVLPAEDGLEVQLKWKF